MVPKEYADAEGFIISAKRQTVAFNCT